VEVLFTLIVVLRTVLQVPSEFGDEAKHISAERREELAWRAGTPQRHLGNSAPGIPGWLYFLPDNRSARATN
jgi:hypothetical protein